MDIMKKVVVVIAIASFAMFMPGCGGDDAPADAEAAAEEAADQVESTGSAAIEALKEQAEEAQE